MNSFTQSLKLRMVGCLLMLLAVPAFAADTESEAGTGSAVDTENAAGTESAAVEQEDLRGPMEDVHETAEVLEQMQSDPEVNALLEQSKGVFVVPDYATAALIIGGSGGEGVLIPKNDGEWGHPAFYDIGSVSAGIQAGIAAGSIALILMNDEALASFSQENNFSLDATAGLSIVNWSAKAEAKATEGDIVAWTDTEGLFGEISVAISDINWDEEENTAYYGEEVTAEEIISGNIPVSEKPELELGQITD